MAHRYSLAGVAQDRRNRFLRLITTISTRCISLEPHEVDGAIADTLQAVAEFMEVAGAYLWQINPGGADATMTHEATATGAAPTIARMQDVPTANFPWVREHLRRDAPVIVPDVARMPPEAASDQAGLQELGETAFLGLPLMPKGALDGFLAVSVNTGPRDWDDEDIALLALVRDVLVGVLERRRQEEELRGQTRLFDGAAHASHALLTRGDFDAAIGEALAHIGTALAVDRASIARFHLDPGSGGFVWSLEYEWCREGVASQLGRPGTRGVPILAEGFAPWIEALQAGLTAGGRLCDMPPRLAQRYAAAGIASLNLAPIFANGTLWGCAAFDQSTGERDWTARETAVLRVLAEGIGGALTREHQDAALRDSEMRLSQASHMARVGSWEWDLRTDSMIWSDEMYEILGVPHDAKLTLQSIAGLVHPDDREAYVRAANAAIAGHSRPVQYRVIRPDGAERVVREVGEFAFDEQGAPVKQVGALQDVTDLEGALQALRKSEEQFRITFEHAAVGIVQLNMDGTYRAANPRACAMLGYAAAELAALHIRDVLPRDELARGMAMVEKLVAGELPSYSMEHRNVRKDGSVIWVRASVSLVRDAAERPEHLLIFLEDITERKQLEAQVQHAQKLESLGVLAGGIAHDFNNLLVGVLGNANLARLDAEPGSPLADSLLAIERAAERAADLTKQLLAYSGKGKFVIEGIDLSALVAEMGQLLETAVGRTAALQYVFEPDLPAVEGDATQLRQVVMNLITNAAEAMGDAHGAIQISTRRVRADRVLLSRMLVNPGLSEGDYVCLEVKDTGCGMDESTQQRIFDPFFSTKATGHGLGLAAVVGIIRSHSGGLAVTSVPGVGTTFTVLLPVADVPLPAVRGDASAAAPDLWEGSGLVLVVDDEESVRDLATRILERHGFAVITAVDGADGLERFTAHADELAAVLLDMTMPRMHGQEAFHRMQRVRADVPVILSSGYTEQEAGERFGGAGPAGFVQKPYRAANLIDALQRVLS